MAAVQPSPPVSRWASPVFACLVIISALALSLATDGSVAVEQHRWPWQPNEWDPRVTELVAFIENERGLSFDHPIEIVFLPRRDFYTAYRERSAAFYQARNGADADPAPWPERSDIDRAFGLLEGAAEPAEPWMGTGPPEDYVPGPIAVYGV